MSELKEPCKVASIFRTASEMGRGRPIRISIVGTCGRGNPPMTNGEARQLYFAMVDRVRCRLQTKYGDRAITLISGGAAWADQVAITTMLSDKSTISKLLLHFPCEWVNTKARFKAIPGIAHDPGTTSNKYHTAFQDTSGVASFFYLQQCLKLPTVYAGVSGGFKARNKKVAQCDVMIAFTWDSDEPVSGGTAYTWRMCKAKTKIHYCLGDLLEKVRNRTLYVE